MLGSALTRSFSKFREQHQFPRTFKSPWTIWLAGVPLVALLGGALHFAGIGPFHELTESQAQEAALQRQIQVLQEENRQLLDDINLLAPDKSGIEKIAREKLHLSREGEIVLYIPHKR